MKKFLSIALFFITTQFSFAAATPPKEYDDALTQKLILQYVNEYRAKHHLGPLKLDATASREAAIHSQAMANKSVPFGHSHFNDRIKHIYKVMNPCRGGAENVAYYKLNAKLLVDGWIASPGHRRNIEGHYNVTGIGIAHGKSGWGYFTQIFVKTDNPKYA